MTPDPSPDGQSGGRMKVAALLAEAADLLAGPVTEARPLWVDDIPDHERDSLAKWLRSWVPAADRLVEGTPWLDANLEAAVEFARRVTRGE